MIWINDTEIWSTNVPKTATYKYASRVCTKFYDVHLEELRFSTFDGLTIIAPFHTSSFFLLKLCFTYYCKQFTVTAVAITETDHVLAVMGLPYGTQFLAAPDMVPDGEIDFVASK